LEVQNAEATLADRLRSEGPAGPASKIIASLRRKAQSYGPSYSFRIPLPNGHSVQGLLRSVGVQFTFDRSMPADLRQRILQFLTRLGLGTLEEGTEDQPVQVLLDLPGPSSYMRDAPGVPWQEVYSGPAMTAEAD